MTPCEKKYLAVLFQVLPAGSKKQTALQSHLPLRSKIPNGVNLKKYLPTFQRFLAFPVLNRNHNVCYKGDSF